MISEFAEIINVVEDCVDWLRNVVTQVVEFHFLSLDLLRSDFAISIEQMGKESPNVGRVLASGLVKQGAKIDGISGLNNLCNESLLGGLAELKSLFAFLPDIFGSFDLWASTGGGRDEWAGVTGRDPGQCIRKCCVAGIGEK